MQTLRKKDRAKGQSEAKGGGKEGGKAKAEGFCIFLDGQLMAGPVQVVDRIRPHIFSSDPFREGLGQGA